jgi:hypothetical protein
MLHKTYSPLVVLAFITLATAQLCVFNVGSCLRIRDSDNLAVSRVLGCVPDGTRLNDLGRSSNRDGINWRNVGYELICNLTFLTFNFTTYRRASSYLNQLHVSTISLY